MCHCSNLYHICNNNYNNNYSFVTTFLQATFVRYSSHTLFCLQNNVSNTERRSLNMQLHTRVTELLLTAVCLLCLALLLFITFSLTNVLEAEGWRSCLLENSIATACMCEFFFLSVSHICCCWVIWKVFVVFVSMYLCTNCLLLHLLSLCLRYLSPSRS